jgi:signal peptidase I
MTILGLAMLLVTALAIGVAMVRRRWVVTTVRGTSMTPTFVDGQRVLARRPGRRPIRRGDVVVFRTTVTSAVPLDPQWRLKRVAAIAGDPVPTWLDVTPNVVPTGRLVIVGDAPNSGDSRQLGLVPLSEVTGVVVRWPSRWWVERRETRPPPLAPGRN